MKHNQDGFSSLLIPLIISIILFLGTGIYLIVEVNNVNKYKNHADDLINAAVDAAKSKQQADDNKTFYIASQNPYVTYNGPAQLGSIKLSYPKNWSAYISTSDSNNPMDAFFSPNYLPSVSSQDPTNYALRLRISSASYSSTVSLFQGAISSGKATINSYSLPRYPMNVGVIYRGVLTDGQKSGTLVVIPLRTQTLEIWTEGDQFINEFNTILSKFNFSP